MAWWRPDIFAEKIPHLRARAAAARDLRTFFDGRGYLEVETPALQPAPCMEAHIRGFKTEYMPADGGAAREFWLHTSPEFAMKKLLAAGLPAIWQMAQVFRNGESASWHSPAFTMIEWYRAGMGWREMAEETAALLRHAVSGPLRAQGRACDVHAPWEYLTVAEALRRHAGVDIEGNLNDLAHIRAAARGLGVHVSDHDDWDNAVLKILMDRVEPKLGSPAPTVLHDYPVSMAALARAKPEDPRYAERFEIYACGVELANGFGELTDAAVQRERFLHEVSLRGRLYGDVYPVDEDFLQAVGHGLPFCSGNALGFDRLVMLMTGADRIDLVRAAPVLF